MLHDAENSAALLGPDGSDSLGPRLVLYLTKEYHWYKTKSVHNKSIDRHRA